MSNYTKENTKKIEQFILSGAKPSDKSNIGMECEHFIVDKNGRAVSYYGENSVESIMNQLSLFYPNKEYSQGHLIALNDGVVFITLEPAAQIETSIIPRNDLFKIRDEYQKFLSRINSILERYSYSLLLLGYQPKSKADDLRIIPKERYAFMDSYFKSKGTDAKWMMRGSASVQANIDYFDSEDFSLKYKTAALLAPVFYLLTDNAPVFEGERYSARCARSYIWQNVDGKRCKLPESIFDAGFTAEAYARWVYSTEPIFLIDDNGKETSTAFASNDELFSEREISTREIKHIMSMVFPDVRVKQFIEIRTGDSMPIEYAFAYLALIKGVFYNNSALKKLESILSAVSYREYSDLTDNLRKHGFDAEYAGMSVKTFIKMLFKFAKQSLTSREIKLLEPLEALSDSEKTPKSVYCQEAFI